MNIHAVVDPPKFDLTARPPLAPMSSQLRLVRLTDGHEPRQSSVSAGTCLRCAEQRFCSEQRGDCFGALDFERCRTRDGGARAVEQPDHRPVLLQHTLNPLAAARRPKASRARDSSCSPPLAASAPPPIAPQSSPKPNHPNHPNAQAGPVQPLPRRLQRRPRDPPLPPF